MRLTRLAETTFLADSDPAAATALRTVLTRYRLGSKLAIEAYCQAYAATFDMVACSLRFSNAYGPYSLHKRSVVAAWLRSALAGRPIEINGDGHQTRDFVHADDLAAAVEAVLGAPEADVAGELFQAGTGIETTVAGWPTRSPGPSADRSRSAMVRHASATSGRNVARVDKAATVLGYRARVRLADGLAGTAAGSPAALEDPGGRRRGPGARRAPSEAARMTASGEPASPHPDTGPEPPAVAALDRSPASPLLRDAFVTIVTRFGLALLIFATDIACPAARAVGQGRFAHPSVFTASPLIVGWGDGPGACRRRAGRDRDGPPGDGQRARLDRRRRRGRRCSISMTLRHPSTGPPDGPLDGLPHPEPVRGPVHVRGTGLPANCSSRSGLFALLGRKRVLPYEPHPGRPARDPAGDDRRHRRDPRGSASTSH
jgi:hypothetical protein